jgi:hypothetical protein
MSGETDFPFPGCVILARHGGAFLYRGVISLYGIGLGDDFFGNRQGSCP